MIILHLKTANVPEWFLVTVCPSDMLSGMDIVYILWPKTKQNPDLAFSDPYFGPNLAISIQLCTIEIWSKSLFQLPPNLRSVKKT